MYFNNNIQSVLYITLVFLIFRLASSNNTFSQIYDLNGWHCYDSVTSAAKKLYKCVKAFGDKPLTKSDAQSKCAALKGTLLEIYSKNDNNAAVNAIRSDPNCKLDTGYWFGAVATYGLCYAHQSSQCRVDYKYSNWKSGYPTNYDDCGVLFIDSYKNTHWINQQCNTKKSYVCQRLYSHKSECQLTIDSSCIQFGKDITIEDAYVSHLDLQPYITIYETRFKSVTFSGNKMFGVKMIGCTLSNTVLKNSHVFDTEFKNVMIDTSIWNRDYISNVSFLNTKLMRSFISDSKCVNNIFKYSSYNDFALKNVSAFGLHITNSHISKACFENTSFTDVVYDCETTHGIKISNCVFANHVKQNVTNTNVTLTNCKYIDRISTNNCHTNSRYENFVCKNGVYTGCADSDLIIRSTTDMNANVINQITASTTISEASYTGDRVNGMKISNANYENHNRKNVVIEGAVINGLKSIDNSYEDCVYVNSVNENVVHIGCTANKCIVRNSKDINSILKKVHIKNSTFDRAFYQYDYRDEVEISNCKFNGHVIYNNVNKNVKLRDTVTKDITSSNNYFENSEFINNFYKNGKYNDFKCKNCKARDCSESDVKFSKINFVDVNFRSVSFQYISLSNASLIATTFEKTAITRFDAKSIWFSNVLLEYTNIVNTEAKDVNLRFVTAIRLALDTVSINEFSIGHLCISDVSISHEYLTNCFAKQLQSRKTSGPVLNGIYTITQQTVNSIRVSCK